MKVYDYTAKTYYEKYRLPGSLINQNELFIICQTHEVAHLQDIFGFDDSTIAEASDLDESVRYTSLEGYDFISMVHVELLSEEFLQWEINLYVSARYLVLVMPDHDSSRLMKFERKMLNTAKSIEERTGRINILFFSVFHHLLADFSDTLEKLEDRMQALSEEIISHVNEDQFADVNDLKNMAFALKKQIRAISYLGEQILLDENRLIGKGQVHYFRNVNTRLKKLYDFAESLYNLSNSMLYTYDSRLNMKTNETINKLTAVTLFFGPLTVISGIYGMNFTYMPELNWRLGYPLALTIMVAISGVLYFIMKKKRWL